MDDVEDRATSRPLTPARLLLIARRRWWVVLVSVFVAVAASLAYVSQRPSAYKATAAVTVQPLPTVAGSAALPSLPGPDPAVEVQTSAVRDAAASAASEASGSVHLAATTNSAQSSISITATAAGAGQASRAAQAAAVAFVADRAAAVRKLATGLDAQIASLGTQVNALSETAKTNSFDAAKLAVIQGELQSFYTEQENYQVSAQAVQLTTTVLPPAVLAGASRNKIIELALLVGLLIGCGIALVADRLDDRLRSSAELVEIGDVALLAELPVRPPAGHGSFFTADSHDELSEAVRQLRTALRFLSVDKPLRTLLVTSAAPDEGKSFVAANLAVALAVSGARTILVSSDLRRPRLEGLFESAPSSRGLSEAIADAALTTFSDTSTRTRNGNGNGNGEPHNAPIDLEGLLVMTGIPNLLLVPAGASPPNPAELLGSTHMASLIEALEAVSDIVILDSPPVLAVTDALVLTAHADGVVLVVAKGRTSKSSARSALLLLQSGLAPVLGVALNRSTRPGAVPYSYDSATGSKNPRRRRKSHREPSLAPTVPTLSERRANPRQRTP
jgi:succinoglycan biosynthesis transport protein ExoP